MPPVSEEVGAVDAASAAAAAASACSAPFPPLGEGEAAAETEETEEEAAAAAEEVVAVAVTGAKLENGGWCPAAGAFPASADRGGEVALMTDTPPPEKKGEPSPPQPPPPAGQEEDAAAAEAFQPPEGGWGWLVMLAAMWCNGTVFGIQNSCGILFKSMLKEFGGSADKQLMVTALVNSLSMGMIFFCSPIVSIFTNIYGCRRVAVVGAAVAFTGLLSSSFVSSLGPLFFTHGILFGCGCSFAYQPSLVILGHYFKKRLGLVNGIVTAGSSLFTVTLPFLLDKLPELVGLSYTFQILCIFVFIMFLASFTYKPLIPSIKKSGEKNSFPPARKIFNFSVFKITSYRIWAFGLPAALFGYFIPYVHLLKHVKERLGEDVPDVTLLLCLGITSGVGRLIFGRVADYIPGAKKVYLQV